MRICFVLLSPTPGMQLCTADLANTLATYKLKAGAEEIKTDVITVSGAPADRYAPQVSLWRIVPIQSTGLCAANLNLRALWKVYRAIVQGRPDVVHFNGPHVWNPILLWFLRRANIATIQTIHDLEPHSGSRLAWLIPIWNRIVMQLAGHILIHGEVYRKRLIQRKVSAERTTYFPLLHLFLSYDGEQRLKGGSQRNPTTAKGPFALFFARFESYKGLETLVDAMRDIEASDQRETTATSSFAKLHTIIAGSGDLSRHVSGALPSNIEVRTRHIGDDEGIQLFRQCALVVLPYLDATQSALIGAAYFFGKPVIVTRTGALPEYVIEGETGWVIDPGDPAALADCLRRAFADSDRLTRMGEAGFVWYQTQRQHSRDAMVNMYRRVGGRRN